MIINNILLKIKHGLLGQKGVTLVEMLIGVSIGIVVMGASYGIFLTVAKVWAVNSASMDQQADARLAVLKITRELRSASKVVEAKSNFINFQIPVTAFSDEAPTTNGATMDVTFSLETEDDWVNLKRTVVTTADTNSSVVARYLRNNDNPGVTGDATRDLFTYFDSGDNLIATVPVDDPDSILRVRIQVMTEIDTTKRPGESLETTDIVIRTNAIP